MVYVVVENQSKLNHLSRVLMEFLAVVDVQMVEDVKLFLKMIQLEYLDAKRTTAKAVAKTKLSITFQR